MSESQSPTTLQRSKNADSLAISKRFERQKKEASFKAGHTHPNRTHKQTVEKTFKERR